MRLDERKSDETTGGRGERRENRLIKCDFSAPSVVINALSGFNQAGTEESETTQMAESHTGKKIAIRIPSAAKARIIQLSMQHPDSGPKRLLPLLHRENIKVSASSIYNVLKRHGLQNREKRYARIRAALPAPESPDRPAVGHRPPVIARGILTGDLRSKVPPREKDRHPVSRSGSAKILLHIRRPVPRGAGKNEVRIPWALKLVNVALLAALAFSLPYTAPRNRRAGQPPPFPAAVDPGPLQIGEARGKMATVTPPASKDSAPWKEARPESAGPIESSGVEHPPPVESTARLHLSGPRPYGGRARSPWSFDLSFEEIEAGLGNTRRLWQEAAIAPHMKDRLPAGFTITRLAPDALWNKMGLQNGDVIQGLNGETVSSPDQALYFIQALAQGGVLQIKIKRRRRTRYISLTIQ